MATVEPDIAAKGTNPTGKRMSDAELKAIITASRADAMASQHASQLSKDRASAMQYYLGDVSTDMPSIDGRSQVVSTDVSDTIDGLMPSLMEIFAGSDEVVRFDPHGPNDVEAAEQESDYINWVFMQRNKGFLVLYHMLKDALLSKTGIVKVWWRKEETQHRETYYDQPDDVYTLIQADPEVEIVAHTEKPDPTAQMMLPAPAMAPGGGNGAAASTMPPQPAAQAPDSAILVRHGATKLNNAEDESADRIRGWQDAPLSDDGRNEAQRAGDILQGHGIDTLALQLVARVFGLSAAVST